jgi:NADPH:quinone reductase-like Zn-dependent oxidoreductase
LGHSGGGLDDLEAHGRGREARRGVVVKAIRLHAREGPEQLVHDDAPLPAQAGAEAFLRVCAVGITPTELTWSETCRTPDVHERLPAITGRDISGIMEALGPGVSDLSPGDAVYGPIAFLIDAGEIRPVLEAVLPLARARETSERGPGGHVRGKIVLRVEHPGAIP